MVSRRLTVTIHFGVQRLCVGETEWETDKTTARVSKRERARAKETEREHMREKSLAGSAC